MQKIVCECVNISQVPIFMWVVRKWFKIMSFVEALSKVFAITFIYFLSVCEFGSGLRLYTPLMIDNPLIQAIYLSVHSFIFLLPFQSILLEPIIYYLF